MKDKKNGIEMDEIKKLIFLVLGVTVVFFIFYGITLLVLKKEEPKEEKIVTQIDFEKILVNQLLSQPESNYYVLLTIKNDENNETYNSFKETYYKKEGHKIIYQVDLSDPMNKSYLGDETTLQGDVKDFKFKNSVLLEIENGTIKTILDGSTDIISKLRELTA